jgi:hypothetical protein
MNYSQIEKLVVQAKNGDSKAKEALTIEFTPLIANHPIKNSELKGIDYSAVVNRKASILNKLKSALNRPAKVGYLN